MNQDFRVEHDLLGEKEVPASVYWGIHTQRALENFSLSGQKVAPVLIRAMAMVKKACALANAELGYCEHEKARLILAACQELIEGKLLDQFPLDSLQGGAGTSTHMNVNEVLANRALELAGRNKGGYEFIHPLDDVNKHQSTNDVYPTALKIAFILGLRDLSEKITCLQAAFQQKEKEFAAIVKIGRTELQEAVPMTLGQEFSAFSEAFGRDRWRTFKAEERLRVVNIGGTAIGTGLSAPRDYIFLVIEKLREVTGLGLSRGENVVDQTANSDVFIEAFGILKAHAANLVKISNDLRLLNFLGEIKLPALQAGSSLMPGKVNPVLLEAVMQVGLKVMANEQLATEAVTRSTFQINEFMPLLSFSVLESVEILKNADSLLATHILGIAARPEELEHRLAESVTLLTAFLPRIGYEKATAFAKEFQSSGKRDLREFLRQKLGRDLVDEVLSAENLTRLGYQKKDAKDT